jgi:inner membrane protein import complex subunit Tim44-like protein
MEALPAIPATAEARQPALDAALQQLRAADPRFDLGAFQEEVRRRFAWQRGLVSDRHPEGLAGRVSPAVLEKLKATAVTQLAAGVRTEYRNLSVEGLRPIWLVVGPVRDRFTMAIDHSCATTGVSDDTGQVVFGGAVAPGVEYWTLSRPTGAQTPDVESGPQQCPGCGAPADPGRGPICPYCRAELPSALLGWVLDRVDDSLEWAEVAMRESPEEERSRRDREAEDDWVDSQLRGQAF